MCDQCLAAIYAFSDLGLKFLVGSFFVVWKLFVRMKSWIFVSYCLVRRITKEFPLSALAIMASLFLSLVCMDLMVLVSGCVLCLVWELLFITRVFMLSAVSFLYASRAEWGSFDIAV